MLSNSTICYRKMISKRKSQLIQQTLLLSCSKKLPQTPQPAATTTWISQQPPTQRQDLPPATRLQLTKDSDGDYHFLAIKYFLIKICTFFFRHNAVVHSIDYNIKVTLYALGRQKNRCDSFYSNIHFTVVVWNQTRNISELRL